MDGRNEEFLTTELAKRVFLYFHQFIFTWISPFKNNSFESFLA